MLKLISPLFLLVLVSPIASASQNQQIAQLSKCTEIKNNVERLKCFDENVNLLIKKYGSNISEPGARDELIIVSKEEAFGKQVTIIDSLDKINSNIVGPFKGWKKGSVITLENGQKWRVVSNSIGYVNLESPPVQITKSIFGAYKMSVEGLNASAKVKRIK